MPRNPDSLPKTQKVLELFLLLVLEGKGIKTSKDSRNLLASRTNEYLWKLMLGSDDSIIYFLEKIVPFEGKKLVPFFGMFILGLLYKVGPYQL